MTNFIKIAWRNLWRNKRRTLITAASILFAVFFANLMRSFQTGSYDYWINSTIESYTGHLQIQHPDYKNNPVIDNLIPFDTALIDQIHQIEKVKTVNPKLQSFALASSGNQTKVVMVQGIIPENEAQISKLNEQIVQYRLTPDAIDAIKLQIGNKKLSDKLDVNINQSYAKQGKLELDLGLDVATDNNVIEVIKAQSKFAGSYLAPSDNGVLIGDKLAKFLDIVPGDTLVLMGQGYQGQNAAGKFPVRGIVKMNNPMLDKSVVYMHLNSAQQLYSALTPDSVMLISSLSVVLNSKSDNAIEQVKNKIVKLSIPYQYQLSDWKELNMELMQQIESDKKSGQIFIGILYLIIGFGIFGTVLMMTMERKREFGVMVAIGTQKVRLAIIMFVEMIYLAIIGVIAGFVASLPFIYLGHYYPLRFTGEMAKMYEDMGFEPVMPMALFDWYMWEQAVTVFFIVALATLYPVITILKLNVIKSIRGR